MTISDAIAFIHEQRTKREVCKNWTDSALVSEIETAISQNAFGWITDKSGKITGICWGIPCEAKRTLHVRQVVCDDTRSLVHLLLLFKKTYPSWTIEGFRRKKQAFREFHNVDRMVKLLSL